MPDLIQISASGRKRRRARARAEVLAAVKQRLASNCPYAFYFREVTFHFAYGVLTLRGRVPTDRLQQALHALLANLDGVDEINDQVDVINSRGLSHICAK